MIIFGNTNRSIKFADHITYMEFKNFIKKIKI